VHVPFGFASDFLRGLDRRRVKPDFSTKDRERAIAMVVVHSLAVGAVTSFRSSREAAPL